MSLSFSCGGLLWCEDYKIQGFWGIPSAAALIQGPDVLLQCLDYKTHGGVTSCKYFTPGYLGQGSGLWLVALTHLGHWHGRDPNTCAPMMIKYGRHKCSYILIEYPQIRACVLLAVFEAWRFSEGASGTHCVTVCPAFASSLSRGACFLLKENKSLNENDKLRAEDVFLATARAPVPVLAVTLP